MSKSFTLRHRSGLPLYCEPIALFVAVWLLMLGSLQLRLSVDTYLDFTLAWILFGASLASLLLGHITVRGAYWALGHEPRFAATYHVNLTRLRRVQLFLLVVAISIIIFNLIADGLPPIFGFFGVNTKNYDDYGKFKQALDSGVMALFVSASLESSRTRKVFVATFAVFCLLAYATRGFLLIMLAQGLFVFSLRTKLSKLKLYLIAFGMLMTAALLANFIGNGRAEATLVAFFGIRSAYADWPMAFLWVASYIAIPLSNLCWIVHSYPYSHVSAGFLGTLLPAFWAPPVLEATDLGSDHIIDGVHTYLAKYYLDLWFLGIFLINYVWGVISGYLSSGDRMVSRFLTSSILLGALTFIFFVDYLTVLTVVMELIAVAFIQHYSVQEKVATIGSP
jgi:hypothetical protein